MLRHEYKYFVPFDQMDRLRRRIAPFVEIDPFARRHGGQYTVRSIYFDTPEMECYFKKVAGVNRRNKVRLRGYNAGNAESRVFFEIKKKVDGPLYKNRAVLSYEAAQQVVLGKPLEEVGLDGDDAEDARRFLYHLHARRMRPVITIIYEREPFQATFRDAENDLRLTFDKNLRAVARPSLDELFADGPEYPVETSRFILEVKFNRYLPGWVKAVIASMGLNKGPASKYVMCLDAHPEFAKKGRRGNFV
jgi:VTC domain